MGIILGSAFFLGPRVAMAQAAGVPGITASNVPVLVSGQLPSALPQSEEAPPNALTGSITAGFNYDDNVFPNTSSRQWDIDYSITPQISLDETRSRIVWGLSYAPGVQISQNLLYRSYFSQRFGGDLAWQVSPHGTLSAQQYYLVTTNPFAGFTTTQPGPTISPNETIYVPNVRQTMLLSNALYSYQASARTTMGVGGNFEQQKYDSIPQTGNSIPLLHTQLASGNAFISQKLSAREQLGFQYSLQVMKFPQADARTTTHSFLVFNQLNLSSNASLTLYGGPEYSLTAGQVVLNLGFIVVSIPVNTTQWSAAGGVLYDWTGHRLATSINFSRRVSDGGALVGAVELTSGSAQLSWQLTPSWSLTSTIAGAENQLLTTNGELLTYSGQIGIRRQLGRSLEMRFYDERLNETGSITGFSVGNRDVIGAALTYSFSRPLGG